MRPTNESKFYEDMAMLRVQEFVSGWMAARGKAPEEIDKLANMESGFTLKLLEGKVDDIHIKDLARLYLALGLEVNFKSVPVHDATV